MIDLIICSIQLISTDNSNKLIEHIEKINSAVLIRELETNGRNWNRLPELVRMPRPSFHSACFQVMQWQHIFAQFVAIAPPRRCQRIEPTRENELLAEHRRNTICVRTRPPVTRWDMDMDTNCMNEYVIAEELAGDFREVSSSLRAHLGCCLRAFRA